MAFTALKTFLNIKKPNNHPKNLLKDVEPYDFKTNLSVKIDKQTNCLVGLPSEWEETFRLNKLDPIFGSIRNRERKGLIF
jgi:hypothetical protein